MAFIWQVPPETVAGFNGATFTLTTSIDSILAKITATSTLYTESSLSFMTPPNPADLSKLKKRGAKVMAYHGTSDPIFSSDDTQHWYDQLRVANGGDASNFARFYRVPGMNHCSGGPTTDQFDMLTPLVNWVEKGQAAGSRRCLGTGNGKYRWGERRRSGRLGRRSDPPAVRLPEGRAVQGQRRHREGRQLQLPVGSLISSKKDWAASL